MANPLRVGLFGFPGAGKGTQAEKIVKMFKIPHISTGDMFREMQKGTSSLAMELKKTLASGELVSDELVTKLALDRLSEEDCENGFILDGYPRTISQAKAIQASEASLDTLLVIEVSKEEIVRRLSGRRVCSICNAIYHVDTLVEGSKERCPKDDGLLIQRKDDEPESIKKRLSIFEQNLNPLLKFFDGLGKLRRVDGNHNPENVFEKIKSELSDLRA